ncbi:odontogenesis associated phosphoprotein [Phyllostomus discolor]|uniref:Odontogenesis associated phosphoprotein n=1 Tax=Phyllostomus discolor TaxID=89673 RepID=A0A6J2L4U6_9CHIR|nr:odontogenesis associated phosphoprotein [Phyllostomus discolor]
MAHKLCFSYWLLACWLVVTVAEGQEAVTPPGGSQDNVDSTDCQIFTLTPPPPTTRKPVTRIQPVTRTPKGPFYFFPTWRPGVHIGFPNRPFLPPRCNHRFHFRPFFWPNSHFIPHYRYFPRRRFRRGSSSEENRWKREAPNLLKQKKPIPQKRL